MGLYFAITILLATVVSKTLSVTQMPECGVTAMNRVDKIHYTPPFLKEDITYEIQSYPSGMSKDEVREIFKHAFQIYSDESNLKFNEKTPGDITISFVGRDDGASANFDGPEGILARGGYGLGRAIEFDKDEDWADNASADDGEKDLFFMAVHQIGHVLGLNDTIKTSNSIMKRYWKNAGYGPRLGWRLPAFDRENLEKLYGLRFGRNPDCKDKHYNCPRYTKPSECITSTVSQTQCPKSCGMCH